MLFSQSKQKYGFVLGHCPELSQVEIKRVLEYLKIDYQSVFLNSQIFIIEANHQIKVQELQERLGGTIKVSSFKYQVSMKGLSDKVEELSNKRLKDLKIKRQKFQFGFSAFGVNVKELEKIGLTIKKKLTTQGIKSRLVVSKEPVLSSVIVQKENLINQGADIIVVKADNQYFIGYTVSSQEFADYSLRDYGRPTRDDKSGLLPPKLAKMMINISQANINQIILDPFCGSGTIIQEALLLGYKNIIGSDISPQAIEFTRNNLEWLKTKYKLDIASVQLHTIDVGNLSSKIHFQSISTVVTEPYLGPANISIKSEVSSIIKNLSKLYLSAFEEFYRVLKKEGKVVIIFPIINNQKLDILNDIKRMGFIVEPLGEEPRRSIVYSRPNQRVLREIFIFKKN